MDPAAAGLPCAVLKREHGVILRVLDVLERLLETATSSGRLEIDALDQCVEFFRSYADACHHGKEEDLLFPVLERRGIPNQGGPIGVMLYEHEIGRSLVRRMSQALGRLRQGGDSTQARVELRRAGQEYLYLLRQHIFKEDNVLFMMGDQVMSETDQTDLAGRFCDAGCKAFGGKKGEELEAMADELERAWGPAA
jgi:hemerythrin-like domain-containing protein